MGFIAAYNTISTIRTKYLEHLEQAFEVHLDTIGLLKLIL